MQNNIFRKEALQKLKSPEQIDVYLRVVNNKDKIIWLAIVVIMAIFFIWLFFGIITHEVSARGIILLKGNITSVTAPKDGVISSSNMRLGKKVNKNDILAHYEDGTAIVSPSGGVISEINFLPIDFINRGESIALLSPIGDVRKNLLAYVFIDGKYGKIVKPGMKVLVTPSGVNQYQYGSLTGTVASVADIPSSKKSMETIIKTSEFISFIKSNNIAPYQVQINLSLSNKTLSGYKWTSKKGPPFELNNGNLVDAKIIINTSNPIELITRPKLAYL